jgi:VanZ family protein
LNKAGFKPASRPVSILFIHPFVIEGVQFFMPDRTPDAADVLVGLVGTLLGFCLT